MIVIGFASGGDICRGADEPVGNAPGLPIFIEIDNPNEIIIEMSGLDEIGHALSGRPRPAGAANNYANEWWIELQHLKRLTA